MTEKKDESKVSKKNDRIPYLYTSETPQFYATGAFGGYTSHDFRLMFFAEVPLTKDEIQSAINLKVIREVKSEIIMSPLAAKELVDWLSKKVEEFEKDFGKIPEPQKSDEAKKD